MRRIFTAGLLIPLSVALMKASDDSVTRSSLRGVEAFDVAVEAINENALGLTRDDLQTDVELRCRQAGIKLEEIPAPYLYINVALLEEHYVGGKPTNAYAAFVDVRFEQEVLLERDPGIHVVAATWSVGEMVTGPSTELRELCRQAVRDQVDKFLDAFLEQNPR